MYNIYGYNLKKNEFIKSSFYINKLLFIFFLEMNKIKNLKNPYKINVKFNPKIKYKKY
jgi:hypothetical protein